MAGNSVSLHMLMCLDIYMVRGSYKTSLSGCSGIKSQPALCLKRFNKVHICLLLRASQLACHTNPPLISWHEHIQTHGHRAYIQSMDVARPRERLLNVYRQNRRSHRSIVPSPPSCCVWQISHAEHNPGPNMEPFFLSVGIKGSIVLISEGFAHLALQN